MRIQLPGLDAGSNCELDAATGQLNRKARSSGGPFSVGQWVTYRFDKDLLRLSWREPQPPVTNDHYRFQGLPVPTGTQAGVEMVLQRADATRSAEGFVPLFNGKDLTGWKALPEEGATWTVRDGILTGREPELTPDDEADYKRCHLASLRGDYANFHLRVEARVNDHGAGQLWFRVPTLALQRDKSEPLGFFAGISSNGWVTARTGDMIHRLENQAGRHMPSASIDIPKPGAWFTLEVIAYQHNMTVRVNGAKSHWSRATNADYRSGHVVLRVDTPGTVLEIRKIEIKELPAAPAPPAAAAPPSPATAQAPQRDEDQLQGTWLCEYDEILKTRFNWLEGEFAGVQRPRLLINGDRITDQRVADRRASVPAGTVIQQLDGIVHLNPARTPKEITIASPSGTIYGIYQLEGDRLTICYYNKPGTVRFPTQFAATYEIGKNDLQTTVVRAFRRERPAASPAPAVGRPTVDGRWILESAQYQGHPVPPAEAKDRFPSELTFKGNQYGLLWSGKRHEGTVRLDPTKTPAEIDFSGSIFEGLKPRQAIYELAGDRMRLALPYVGPNADPPRPTDFATGPQNKNAVLIYRRAGTIDE
jgi:uncharacterized protein (TIGR03067 family)